MNVDLVETEDAYRVVSHVPGASKEEISIVFEKDVLTVAVSRGSSRLEEDEVVHFRECFSSSSSRSIRFERGKVDPARISATYKDGELAIVLPFHDTGKDKSAVNVVIN